MFLLLLKKSFFDAWDNLGVVVLANLAFFLILSVGLWPMFRMLESSNTAGILFPIFLFPIVFTAGGIVSSAMSRIADYQHSSWSDLPKTFKKTWKSSLAMGVFSVVFFSVSVLGMLYYIKMGSLFGFFAASSLFWISLGVYLVLLWIFPVRNRLSGNFKELLKKSALIAFDNLSLTFFAAIIAIPLHMFLWPLTAFALFGPAGTLLFMDCALRLLTFKYDWLESHQGAKRKDIPWNELLIDEHEKIGKRTLKGMIFPWKE